MSPMSELHGATGFSSELDIRVWCIVPKMAPSPIRSSLVTLIMVRLGDAQHEGAASVYSHVSEIRIFLSNYSAGVDMSFCQIVSFSENKDASVSYLWWKKTGHVPLPGPTFEITLGRAYLYWAERRYPFSLLHLSFGGTCAIQARSEIPQVAGSLTINQTAGLQGSGNPIWMK